MTNQKPPIAIATQNHSLIELHNQILTLLEKQTPESRKLIEQLIDYYNKIILCMPGNVYWMDREGKTIGCNQNVLDLFDLPNQDSFYGLSFADMSYLGHWSKGQGDSFEHDTREVIESGQPKMNVEEPPIPDTTGKLLYFLSSRVPLYNATGEVIGIVGVSTDISKQKRTEIALEHANKVKTEFLANLSHDLRTPLASLSVLTEHLCGKISDPKLSQMAYEAQSCAEQVMLLIDEILEVTELDLGLVPKHEQIFNLEHLIIAVYNLMKTAALQKKLKIHCSFDKNIPAVLIGKRQLLHRILMNLISNAIKFTREGEIIINTVLLEKSAFITKVKIDVSDTGIGIPSDKYEQIFLQFERLTSAYEGEYVGRGLGLYIVKQFVDLMNGQISIDSVEKKGSTFSLILSFKIANETESKLMIREYHPPKQNTESNSEEEDSSSSINKNHPAIRLLLVEDTDIARKVALVVLESLNCQVDIAINGEQAIQKVKNNQYDLILLDIGLPDISGTEVAKRIRTIELESSRIPVPIIALTAHITQSNIQLCLTSGIQQVIKKPLSASRVKALFENWVAEKFYATDTKIENDSLTKIMDEIFEKFYFELPDNLRALEKSFQMKDWNELRNITHKIHGAASYLRLIDLKQICNSLESIIIDNFPDSEIETLYFDLLEKLNSMLKKKLSSETDLNG